MTKTDWEIVTNYIDTVDTTPKSFPFNKPQDYVKVTNKGRANITYLIGSQSGALTPGQSVEVSEVISSFTLTAVSGTQGFEVFAKEDGTEKEENNSNDVMSQLAQKVSSTNIKNIRDNSSVFEYSLDGSTWKQVQSGGGSVDTSNLVSKTDLTNQSIFTSYGAIFTIGKDVILSSKTDTYVRVQLSNITNLTFTATSESKWLSIAYDPSNTANAILVNLQGLGTRNVVNVSQSGATNNTILTPAGNSCVAGDLINVQLKSDRISFIKNSVVWFDVLFSSLSAYSTYQYVLGFACSGSTSAPNIVAQNVIGSLSVTQRIGLLETKTTSQWFEKKAIALGDSITYGQGQTTTGGYVPLLKNNLGLLNYNNQGVSGIPMANGTANNGGNGINAIGRGLTYTGNDLVTIFGGTNDFKLNVPIGTQGLIGDTSFDKTTFYGAYRDLIEYILTANPSIRICIATPLQRDNGTYDVNTTNSAGAKLIDYVNAVKNIGQMYGVPVYDLYANSGITKLTLTTYTADGLHPNDAGYTRIANLLTNFLNNI